MRLLTCTLVLFWTCFFTSAVLASDNSHIAAGKYSELRIYYAGRIMPCRAEPIVGLKKSNLMTMQSTNGSYVDGFVDWLKVSEMQESKTDLIVTNSAYAEVLIELIRRDNGNSDYFFSDGVSMYFLGHKKIRKMNQNDLHRFHFGKDPGQEPIAFLSLPRGKRALTKCETD